MSLSNQPSRPCHQIERIAAPAAPNRPYPRVEVTANPAIARSSHAAQRPTSVVVVQNRNDIRNFLASRRARITPKEAGLPSYGNNRRVPGLRREEVALLAGVSVDYYTRLERGNLNGVSDGVLDALAGALQLDEADVPICSIWRGPRTPRCVAAAGRCESGCDRVCSGSLMP
jgi:hypothetical protein